MRQNETATTSSEYAHGAPQHARGAERGLHTQLRQVAGYNQQEALLSPAPVFLSRGGAGGAGGGAAFDHATAGCKGTLPHQGMMERAFGRSFADVDVYSGGEQTQAGLAAMGARGAARGNTVAFASSSPSPKLVAHELAHVVQGNGAVHASSVVAPDGCAAEVEADQVSERVAAGLPAGPITAAGGGGGIHLDRVPAETYLDGTELTELDGTATPVGGVSLDPLEEREARTGDDGQVEVETRKRNAAGSESSVEVEKLDVDALGTAKNLAKDLRSDAGVITNHQIPELEAAHEALYQRKMDGEDLESELQATRAEIAKLKGRSERLTEEAAKLTARVNAKDPTLTVDQVKETAAQLDAGQNTTVARKSGGKTVKKSANGGQLSDSGYTWKNGELDREVDGEGKVVSGSGAIDTVTGGFKDGKAELGNQRERGDGSSQETKLRAGPDGGGLDLTEKDAEGNSRGGGFSYDAKEKKAAGNYRSQDKDGQYAEGGVRFKQGVDGAEDEWGGDLSAGKAALKPTDGAKSVDLKLSNQEVGVDVKNKLPRSGSEEKGYVFNVGGGGNIRATTKLISKEPLKYSMTVVVSGTFTLGGTADAKNDVVGGSVTAAYTKSLSKTYTRTYDANQASGVLAEFEELQTARPSTVQKWAIATGLIAHGGGDLSVVGDENVSEDTDKLELGGEGKLNAEGVGLSAKASYEGEFKTKVTERVVKPGVVRVTVLYGKAQKATAGGGVTVISNAEYEYVVSWSSAESISIDLKQDHLAYSERIAALKNAKDIQELRQYAADFGGASGWSLSETNREQQGGKGGYTHDDKRVANLSVGIEAMDASEVTNEVSLDPETKTISQKGSGAAQAKFGLSVGGGDVLASDHKDGGSASSVGEVAALTLDSEHKETGAPSSLPTAEDISGASNIVGLVRTLLTDTETALSGTTYGPGDVKSLLGASASKQRWDDAAGLAGLGGASYSAWTQLRQGLRSPAGRNSEYYRQIDAAPNLEKGDKARLKRELNLANQMAALNDFLGATGADGQRAIRMVLERRNQSTSRGGARRQVGEQYYWPSELTGLKAKWTKAQGAVSELQGGLSKLLGSENTKSADFRFRTVRSQVESVIQEFELGREHFGEHPEAHADMLAKMRAQRITVDRLRRRFDREHAARWSANDHSSEDHRPVAESRDVDADLQAEREAAEDAEDAELKRAYAEELKNKLDRQNDRCRGYKARERSLFKEIRGKWLRTDARTLAATDLAQLYDGWLGTIVEYRNLYDQANWPASSRNISMPQGRRTANLEPNYQGLVALWMDTFGNTDNRLLTRVRDY